MSLQIVTAHDATHQNISHLPRGLACGYTTGSPEIRWTEADWAAHPGAVRICQDAGATDHTADVLDVERYAATLADCPIWVTAAAASFTDATRPGQRWPAIYTSANNVTPVVNALIAGGVQGGVGLWVANWNLTESQAVADVQNAAGPFPVIGVQWTDKPGFYDDDVFDKEWVQTVSAPPVPSPHPTRHHADGLTSLAGVCTRHGVRLEAAIWQTAHDAAAGFNPSQRSYFEHGDMGRHMPLGMPYSLPGMRQ